MEELQPAQHAELFLPIDARVLLAQLLVAAGELGREIEAALVALVRILQQRHRDDVLELLGDVLAQRMDRRRRRVDDLVQQLLQVAGAERARARQQLVHHGAERIEVRAVGELEALHLLGRHVGRAARDAFDARDVRVRHQRDAEVDDAHVAVVREHDVRRLDVAMDHAARMRVVQRLGAFVDDLDDVVDAQQVVRAAIGRERARAMHVLGDDVAVAVLFARVVDGKDVRMLQHPDEMRFGEEHLARDARAVLVAARVHVVDLDRDVAPVVRIVREVDDAGAAAADFVDDDVLADLSREPCGARRFFGPIWTWCAS